jgi:hypothetical protein
MSWYWSSPLAEPEREELSKVVANMIVETYVNLVVLIPLAAGGMLLNGSYSLLDEDVLLC